MCQPDKHEMKHTRITPRVIERINARRHAKFGTPEYAAAMRPFVKDAADRAMERALEADGEKLRQLTGKDHGPFKLDEVLPDPAEPNPKLSDPIIGPRIQSLAVFLAVEFAKQDNELDNLGDGESIVFMGKCPTINVVQLAEKIVEYHNTEAVTLQRRIDELARIIKLGETMGDDR